MKSRLNDLKIQVKWQVSIPIRMNPVDSVHVDLGAGNLPRNPFLAKKLIATDFQSSFLNADGIEFIEADLTKPLPFKNDSIDSFSAYDLLEHIPRWERENQQIVFPFINLMSEISRCLKPGGIFLAVTPSFPSEGAFQDPTHINFISPATINYFVGKEAWARKLNYGFSGTFECLTQFWLRGSGPYGTWSEELSNKGMFHLAFLKKLIRFALRYPRQKPIHLVWVLRKLD